MLDYLISLMDDANDFSWDAAKASHAVLLCRMERGRLRTTLRQTKSNVLGGQTLKGTYHNQRHLYKIRLSRNLAQK